MPSRHGAGQWFEWTDYLSPKDRKRVDLFTLFALAAPKNPNPSELATNNREDQAMQRRPLSQPVSVITNLTRMRNRVLTIKRASFITFSRPAFLANLAAGNVSIQNMV